MVGNELDGAPLRLGEALLDLAGLLRNVHVQGERFRESETRDVVEPIGRDGANAVRCHADADVVVLGVARGERLDVGESSLERAVAEAKLRTFRGPPGAAARVDHTKKRDAKARVLGRTDHGVAHHRALGVRRAVRLVMHVMKLAHRQHAGTRELAVGNERDVVDRFRRERAREAVHGLSPSPEVVGLARRFSLRGTAHRALEGVRVDGSERG